MRPHQRSAQARCSFTSATVQSMCKPHICRPTTPPRPRHETWLHIIRLECHRRQLTTVHIPAACSATIAVTTLASHSTKNKRKAPSTPSSPSAAPPLTPTWYTVQKTNMLYGPPRDLVAGSVGWAINTRPWIPVVYHAMHPFFPHHNKALEDVAEEV